MNITCPHIHDLWTRSEDVSMMEPCPNREAEEGCRLLKYMPPGRTRQLCNGSLHNCSRNRSINRASALSYLLEHGRMSIQEYEALWPQVNRRTLQRDLKGLVGKGLLVERGTGPTDPTRHYRLTESIPAPDRKL
jgi:hypothetical protein